MPHIVTVPQQFRDAGYTTLGGGKTFHYNSPPYWDDVIKGSWSTEIQHYYPFWEYGGSSDFAFCPINDTGDPAWPVQHGGGGQKGASTCVMTGDEYEDIYDMRLANHTIKTIRLAVSLKKPWFVMVGFRRPHRDFKVHKKYWDLYPHYSEFATAKHKTRGKNMPLIAFHPGGFTLPNGTGANGDPDTPWPTPVQQFARKSYDVAVTQTDHYVGMLLDELDALGVADKTIVVVHSDHGWQLGEKGLWDKQTEFELATRVPLIIKVPWKTSSAGKHVTSALVELIDLHPTLAAMAGLPYTAPTQLPPPVEELGTGTDLSPLFDAPAAVDFKNASFSQWPVCTTNASVMCMACTGPKSSRAVLAAMGYSIRTLEWRLTMWQPFNTTTYLADWHTPPIAVELYDHRGENMSDFDSFELANVAADEAHAPTLAAMQARLRAQYNWPAAWLAQSRQGFLRGQLNMDLRQGWFPHSGQAMPPPDKQEL